MNVIYRISPFIPDNPPEFYPEDKWKMVEACHESFLKAGGDECKTTYILDSCEEWSTHFRLHGEVINISSHSKVSSLICAYETASKMSGKVLFVEDDYLWRPDTLKKLENALDFLSVVSPYDHPAHYIEERFDKRYLTKLIDNDVYRQCPSNTHTFATTTKILEENWDTFIRYGVNDHGMFTELNQKAQLWCPTHSFATHLAKGYLAPNVDWTQFLKTS